MKHRYRFYSLLAAVVLLSGCTATKITSDWKDPSYQKKPAAILVMALMNDPTQRRLMEDELSSRLEKEGVKAVPAYTILAEAKPARDVIDKAVQEVGADSLFMTRVVDRKTVAQEAPGTYYPPLAYQDWHSYFEGMYAPYPSGSPPWMTPGFIGPYPQASAPRYSQEVYNIAEANLYDTETRRLAWSARTETRVQGDDKHQIESYASRIIESLRSQDLLG